jgi:hypothetical protein
MTSLDDTHRHDRHCYWHHLRCGWVCGPVPPAREPERAGAQEPAEEPALVTAP